MTHGRICMLIVGLILLLAACQPGPEQLVVLPTQAALPTIPTATETPIPLPTSTPRPTLPPTFTPTFTPTATASRTPTIPPTEDRTRIERACSRTLDAALLQLARGCDGTEPGHICYGSPLVTADNYPDIAEPDALLSVEDTAPLSHILRVQTSRANLQGETMGTAYVQFGGDVLDAPRNQPVLAMALLGGATLVNRIPSETEQAEFAARFPADAPPPPPPPPMTRLGLVTGSPSIDCNDIPSGVLLQTTAPARIDINGSLLDIEGTVYLTAPQNGPMRVVSLEGETRWYVENVRRNLPPGTEATADMDVNGDAFGLISPLDVANPQTLSLLLDGPARAVFDALYRPIPMPEPPSPVDLLALNGFTDEWEISTTVVQLTGLYDDDDPVNEVLTREVLDSCQWQGAWLVGAPSLLDARLQMDADEQFISIESFYPDTPFPARLERFNVDEPLYRGGAINDLGASFNHSLRFTSPTTFDWRVEVSGFPGTSCTGGVVQGEGRRVARAVNDTLLQTSLIGAWEVGLAEDINVEVAAAGALPICGGPSIFPDLPESALFSVLVEDRSEWVRITTLFDEVAFPDQLDQSENDELLYAGAIKRDGFEYLHEVRFTNDQVFLWAMVVRDISNDCRLSGLEGLGVRF